MNRILCSSQSSFKQNKHVQRDWNSMRHEGRQTNSVKRSQDPWMWSFSRFVYFQEMAVIQTTNQKPENGQTYTVLAAPVETTSSPIDSAIIEVTTVESPQNTSQNSIPDDQITEGCPLKQYEIWKKCKKLHRKAITQIVMALFRNILCWSGLFCLIVLMSQASIILDDWNTPKLVVVVVIICAGFLTLGFHAHRTFLDLTFQKPTLVMDLLRDAVSREEFNRKIHDRELSAPEIFLQVSLRGGAMSYEDPNHWTRSPGRKTTREISYRGWADQSKGVHSIPWPDDQAGWIIVAKDFRCLDSDTMTSVEKDAADFRKETDFDRNMYFMNFEYILQWKESDSCPDAEPFLVFPDERTSLYNVDVYRACMILCVDSIYRIVFHLRTRNMKNYYIKKFIER